MLCILFCQKKKGIQFINIIVKNMYYVECKIVGIIYILRAKKKKKGYVITSDK